MYNQNLEPTNEIETIMINEGGKVQEFAQE